MDVLCFKLIDRMYRRLGACGALLVVPTATGGVRAIVETGLPPLAGFPAGCGLAAFCLQLGQVARGTRQTVPPQGAAYWDAHGLSSALALPLRGEAGVAVGALTLYATRREAFSDEMEMRAQVLADALAALLDRRTELEHIEARRVLAVEASERRFQSFMNEAPMLAWIKDGQDRFVYANALFEQEMGLQPGVILGQTDAFYLPPDIVGPLQDNDRRVREERVVVHTEELVPRPGELPRQWWVTKFPMQGADGSAHCGGVATDLSALRSAERSVQQLQARLQQTEIDLRTVVDSMADPVNINRHGVILYANAATAALLGVDGAGSLIGANFFDFVLPEDRQLLDEHYARLEAGDRISSRRRLRRHDGSVVVVDVVANNITLADGQATIGVLRDITTRLHDEEQAQLTARLASIGTLSAGVAHEINNPLAYVLTNLKMVTEALAEDAPVPTPTERAELAEMAGDALHGADRIRRIVAGLRTLGRGGQRLPGALRIEAVLRTALDLTGTEIRHRAQLVERYAPTPQVLADETELVQVFVNLLANAAQAIEPHAVARHAVTVTAATNDAGQVVVEVQDDGSGIRPEHLPRVFDPFFTTKPVNSGMGLGLSMTHSIVTRLGGGIEVVSELGKGTTFRVTLPPAPASATVATRGASSPKAHAAPRASVLIIDDDEDVARALSRQLGSVHEVEVAVGAESALARSDLARFDLLLCDVMMPGVDGLGLHARLKARAPEVAERVVFMTGGVFSNEVDLALSATGRTVLDKPLDPEKVQQVLWQATQREEA